MQTVNIKVDKKGVITYETQGFVGEACKSVQNVMVGIGQVSCDRPTGEMFTPAEKPVFNELMGPQ